MASTTFDQVGNYGFGTVKTVPSPADTGTTLVLDTGHGARFPVTASGLYNLSIYPAGSRPLASNAEIVRVTNRATDTFTITRAQESTSNRTILVGDYVMLTPTKKIIDDITTATNVAEVAVSEGWNADSNTWTYASATTFTITGNFTLVYQKGVKLRYKQGGAYKYGIVESSSYGAPNTTVTLIANNDYSIANSAITDNYYSLVEAPLGWPDWFAYTPTWTGVTADPVLGNGTIIGKSKISGSKTLDFRIYLLLGSTTTTGTGVWEFGIPSEANSAEPNLYGTCVGRNTGVQTYTGVNLVTSPATRVVLADSSSVSSWGPTVPFTWANLDFLRIDGRVELS